MDIIYLIVIDIGTNWHQNFRAWHYATTPYAPWAPPYGCMWLYVAPIVRRTYIKFLVLD